jgi:hypothetical protein
MVGLCLRGKRKKGDDVRRNWQIDTDMWGPPVRVRTVGSGQNLEEVGYLLDSS